MKLNTFGDLVGAATESNVEYRHNCNSTGLSKKRTDDPVIREALVRKRLRPFRQDMDLLVLQELGLAHARVRVDVAVLNGVLHGYEIKSDRDNLNRLESQLEIYQQALQKLTS